MRRIPILLCVSLAVLVLCGLTVSMTTAEPQQRATAKVGEFSTVKITKRRGSASALDIHSDEARAIRLFVPVWPAKDPPVEQKDPVSYFAAGGYFTKGWIVISGTSTGTGDGYNIEYPTKDPVMLGIWSDVIGPAIEVRTANTDDAGSYLFQGLDRNAHYVFSIEQKGELRWGAASRAAMDTRLYRSAAKTLKTDGTLVVADKLGIGTSEPASALHVKGSQSVQRTPVAADYAVTDSDYYIGVTNTAARRSITLPPASGRTGRVYIIKDESGKAAAHPIAVRVHTGETIDGEATRTIGTNYGVLRVISSGTSWFSM